MNSIKSWKKPTLEQVEKTISLLIHPQQRIYFFNHLQNPKWIEPLQKKGFFQHSPQIIQHSNEGTVSFPIWAESRYLARMATYEPDTILKIIQDIQTDNPNIHIDLIDAVLKMPSKVAVQLVPKFKTWLELPYSPNWIAEKIGDFIIHLAKGGQNKKALDLTRTLLGVMPDTTDRVYGSLLTPQTRLDNWNYEKILKEYVPELIEVTGEKAWIVLIFLLNDAIKYSGCDEQQNDCPIWEDYSRIWRYAVEDSHRNRDDIKSILATSIRDTAAQILSKDSTKMQSLVQNLEKRRWRIFHRIALYLIREFPSKDPSLFLQRLVDHKRFIDGSSYEDYEYAILLQENFHKLPVQEQEKILRWIENPDLKLPWQDDEDKKAQCVRYWQLHKLTLIGETVIKNYLPVSWQQRYNQLVDEFGAAEFSKIVSEGVGEVRVIGTISPKTDSELESMSIEEMVLFLEAWEPKSTNLWDYDEPSRQGLGSSLTRLAEKNPLRYAQAAEQFQGLHPTYLWNLLWGLQKALNNQKTQQASAEIQEFPWSSVLNLCHWLVEESHQINEPETTDIDSSSPWHQTCRSVADLLATGLTLEPIGIPFNLREFVWNILKPLTQYPDPPPKGERDYTGSNMNPHELSINTVRGEAMHTVVHYALWIRQHFEQMGDSQELLERGFEEMPEVRQVLDTHLDLDQELSLAIRSVYGRWFPWLALLDPYWAKQNVGKIFPRDEALSDFRRTAWETYITFCPVYNNVFSLLYQEYGYEVGRINIASDKRQQTHFNPKKRLAQHLMTLYWLEKLDLDEEESLLKCFFDLAPDNLRGEALEFVGRSLHNTEDMIDPPILNRLKLLWEHRLEVALNSAELGSYAIEIAAFSWWFVSQKFDDSWAISNLKQVIGFVDKVESDFLIIKRLAALVNEMPIQVMECFKLMLEKDNKGWGKYGWSRETKPILTAAIQSNNDTAKKIAEDIIHRLGERGFWEFRELLSSQEKQI